mmetsp:Transcript_18375/g.33017  ORF Transcript_18375/g.33017 Transcript_18375/m.33017 type:complete len:510 (+) Transcript_18375:2705-4234(+)
MKSVDIVTQDDQDSLRIFELLFDLKQQRTSFKALYVSSFWAEKLLIMLQGLQLFSLIYLANYDNWPTLWIAIVKSSIVNLIAGDFASYSYEDLVEDSDYRAIYTALWLLFSYAALFGYFFVRIVMSVTVLFKVKFQRVAFAAAVLLYLPAAIGIIPASICTYDGCWSSPFPTVLLLLFAIGVFLVFFIGFPVYLFIHARSHIITPDSEAHEEFVQLRETEFVLQVSHNWLSDKYYLFSSYKLSYGRIYNKPIQLLVMFSLVVIHAILGGFVAAKMLIMCCICCGFALYATFLPAYRCMSSSWLQMAIWWIACFNASVGYFRADDYDSELLVDTNLTLFLSVINMIGISLIGFVLLFSLIFCLKWPVHLHTIKELALGYRYLLNDLRNAQRMILVLRSLRSFQFVKAQNIVEMITLLREHYLLLYGEKHALQYTVLEQMDVLNFLKERVDRFSLLPCRRLEENFDLLVKLIKRRTREQVMVNPLKRRLLLKMFILKMFLGHRTLKHVSSE